MTIQDDKNNHNPWDEDDGNTTPKRTPKRPKPEDTNEENIDQLIKKGQERILDLLKGVDKSKKNKNSEEQPNNSNNFPNFSGGFPFNLPSSKLIPLIIGVLLMVWLSTGFYTVQPDEQGVIMRFGKYARTSNSGLNYKLPNPIESLTLISVTRVNKEEIGFRTIADSDRNSTNSSNRKNVPVESQMLTGDENIIDIDFDVQWVIKDAKQFLFNVRDINGENTVKNTAESAMRDIIGQVGITEALAEERNRIELAAKTLLQQTLDNYGMGVQVMRLQMLRVEPPPEVLAAYRDVQSSKADREKEINQAMAYRNEIIPKARGDAAMIVQTAEAYQKERVALAEGEAKRFNEIYMEYIKAKDVTRKRMYLETMEKIMARMNKTIMDNKSTAPVIPYLPLDKVKQAPQVSPTKSNPNATLYDNVGGNTQ